MISVVICKPVSEDIWIIDTWLMSCRVLKRRVEDATLIQIVKGARRKKVKTIRGIYAPTTKNKMVKDLYGSLGFQFVEINSNHEIWELSVSDYQEVALPMQIEREHQ